jgi:hypothetical protein
MGDGGDVESSRACPNTRTSWLDGLGSSSWVEEMEPAYIIHFVPGHSLQELQIKFKAFAEPTKVSRTPSYPRGVHSNVARVSVPHTGL